jgi:hypothetical protein
MPRSTSNSATDTDHPLPVVPFGAGSARSSLGDTLVAEDYIPPRQIYLMTR